MPFIKELRARWSLDTPTIFKHIGNAGVYLAASGAGFVGLDKIDMVHKLAPEILPTIGGYMFAIGSVIKVICRLPVQDATALSAKLNGSGTNNGQQKP